MFTPILENGSLIIGCPASDSPNADFQRLGWVRRYDLDQTRTQRVTTAYQSPIGAVIRFNSHEEIRAFLDGLDGFNKMRVVKVTCRRTDKEKTEAYQTPINGTDRSIASYFQGMPVTFGLSDDPNAVVIKVECPINPSYSGWRSVDQRSRRIAVTPVDAIKSYFYTPMVTRDSHISGTRLIGGRESIDWLQRLPHGYVNDFNGVIFSFGRLLLVGETLTLDCFAERIRMTGNDYAAQIVQDCADYDRKKAEADRRRARAVGNWEREQNA